MLSIMNEISSNNKKKYDRIVRYCRRISDLVKFIKSNNISYKVVWYFLFNKKKYREFVENIVQSIDCISSLDKMEDCSEYRIWTMWWQGEEQMPILVRRCIESMRQHSKYQVVLITEENVENYISIPIYIKKKVEEGKISFTHLSDYIRVSLLYQYGGIWLDACIYVTKDIPDYDKKIIYSIKSDTVGYTGFCIGTNKKYHYFFGRTKELFEAYHQQNQYLVEYFLIEYLMERSIRESMETQTHFMENENNNEDFHFVLHNMSEIFCEEKWEEIVQNNVFQKVSYKKAFVKSKNGVITYGGKLFGE